MKLLKQLLLICFLVSSSCCYKRAFPDRILGYTDKVKKKELEERKNIFNNANLIDDSLLVKNFDLNANAFIYFIKGEETYASIIGDNIYDTYKITIEEITYNFIIDYNTEKIVYISTSDTNFICNNYKIGQILDSANIDKNKMFVRAGWGYFYSLDDNWFAFVGSEENLDYMITSFFKGSILGGRETLDQYEKRRDKVEKNIAKPFLYIEKNNYY